jgi:hypothetical protein
MSAQTCPDCKRERGPGNEGKCGALEHPLWAEECMARSYQAALARIKALEAALLVADRMRLTTVGTWKDATKAYDAARERTKQ